MIYRCLALFGILVLWSCNGSPTLPTDASEGVILLGSEAGEILVLYPQAPRSGGQVDRIPIPRYVDGFALSSDRSTLYFTAFNQLPDRKLHALDLRTLELVQSRSIAELLGTDQVQDIVDTGGDRKSTRLNSSHVAISYAVFCLKKKNHGGGSG